MTAREAPLARPIGSGAESAPHGMRGQRLAPGLGAPEIVRPEDVELAVLRDAETTDGRVLKRAGYGTRDAEPSLGTQPFEQVSTAPIPAGTTPRSPEARGVKTGTLLSVGSIDPRAPTERALETPRMFFTRAESEAEVYFKPKVAPRATEHNTIEIETIKIAESADPRRARTQPRLRAPIPRPPPDVQLVNLPPPDDVPTPALAVASGSPEDPELDEPLQDPDEISTTPEPFVRKRDELKRIRPADTLDQQKISTHRELPRHRQKESTPPPAADVSLPPAEVPEEALAAQRGKRVGVWPWALGTVALAILLVVWLTRGEKEVTPRATASGTPSAAAQIEPSPAPAPNPAPAPEATSEPALSDPTPAPSPSTTTAVPVKEASTKEASAKEPPQKAAERSAATSSVATAAGSSTPSSPASGASKSATSGTRQSIY